MQSCPWCYPIAPRGRIKLTRRWHSIRWMSRQSIPWGWRSTVFEPDNQPRPRRPLSPDEGSGAVAVVLPPTFSVGLGVRAVRSAVTVDRDGCREVYSEAVLLECDGGVCFAQGSVARGISPTLRNSTRRHYPHPRIHAGLIDVRLRRRLQHTPLAFIRGCPNDICTAWGRGLGFLR
jgi:hypothetical protein